MKGCFQNIRDAIEKERKYIMKKRSDSSVERQLLKALKLGDGVKAEEILRETIVKITKKMVLAAAKRGGAKCLDLLIQNGADLDFRLRDTRMTLLHVVCESKYADADSLKVLIRNGGLDANASTRFLNCLLYTSPSPRDGT